VRYAELHALSNFTFLRGASHPEELVRTAAELGYDALAITDECTMSGIVRAHTAAREYGLKKLIIGSELHLRSGRKLVVLAQNRAGYAALCGLITRARRAADKGHYELTRSAFENGLPGCIVLWIPDQRFDLDVEDHWLRETFRDRLWIAVELLADGRQAEGGHRVHVAGREAPEAAVAEARLLLVLEQVLEREVEGGEGLAHLVLDVEAEQRVAELRAEQVLGRQVDHRAVRSLEEGARRSHPPLEQAVAHRVGQRPLQVQLWRRQQQDQPTDAPGVRCHRLWVGNAGPQPAGAVQVLQPHHLDQRLDLWLAAQAFTRRDR